MCLELTYRNSPSEYMVDYAYLAVKDKMLVNKVFEDDTVINGINYGGDFLDEGYVWIRLEKGGEPLLTALINYSDSSEWEGSLQQSLTFLYNDDLYGELVNNVIDMMSDANIVSGFSGTYIGELITDAFNESEQIFIQTVDFGMHLPSYDDLHPFYDT